MISPEMDGLMTGIDVPFSYTRFLYTSLNTDSPIAFWEYATIDPKVKRMDSSKSTFVIDNLIAEYHYKIIKTISNKRMMLFSA